MHQRLKSGTLVEMDGPKRAFVIVRIMHELGEQLDLYLNGTCVGQVAVKTRKGSWVFGAFTAGRDFSTFAGLFNRWAQEMQDDEAQRKQRNNNLHDIELQIDALKAELRSRATGHWHRATPINIIHDQIEWKEY